MSVESTIFSIHKAGFRVLNLFELKSGLWQANVCDDEKAWEFGVSKSPEMALLYALREAQTKHGSSFLKGRTIPAIDPDDLF